MFLSCIAALTTDIAVLAWCKPISATWDKRTGSCADASIITNVSYFISTISIITDFSCAILPVFILSSVQLHLRIKASVAIILALGVVASTATLVRLRYLFSYNNPTDYLYNIANIAIWSIVESGIGLIAGSLPALRPLLRYVPFLGGDSGAGSSDRTRSRALSGALTFRRSRNKLETPHTGAEAGGSTTCEAGKRSWLELSDAESQKYILKESHVAVTNVAVADIEASDKRASRQSTAGHFDRSRFDE
ncbi:hypothetical protein DBV05_g9844 [Lasiodiplodia theobromae]|uniref:Rhodopsin domain-containing protein n=1 Tax=Lasiodiplodia theobromae TaxID=45133 RepID=A0A5N5D1D4_9PEZI|nr:hypothetical protein DBV05_g9844 [Lasiodiplodia theobromae]